MLRGLFDSHRHLLVSCGHTCARGRGPAAPGYEALWVAPDDEAAKVVCVFQVCMPGIDGFGWIRAGRGRNVTRTQLRESHHFHACFALANTCSSRRNTQVKPPVQWPVVISPTRLLSTHEHHTPDRPAAISLMLLKLWEKSFMARRLLLGPQPLGRGEISNRPVRQRDSPHRQLTTASPQITDEDEA